MCKVSYGLARYVPSVEGNQCAWHWMHLSTTTGDCRIPMSGHDSCRNSPGLISTISASRPRKRSHRSCNSWSYAEASESDLSSCSLVVADERYLVYIPPQRLSCNPHMYTPISPQNPVCSLCRKMLGICGAPFPSPGGLSRHPGSFGSRASRAKASPQPQPGRRKFDEDCCQDCRPWFLHIP